MNAIDDQLLEDFRQFSETVSECYVWMLMAREQPTDDNVKRAYQMIAYSSGLALGFASRLGLARIAPSGVSNEQDRSV